MWQYFFYLICLVHFTNVRIILPPTIPAIFILFNFCFLLYELCIHSVKYNRRVLFFLTPADISKHIHLYMLACSYIPTSNVVWWLVHSSWLWSLFASYFNSYDLSIIAGKKFMRSVFLWNERGEEICCRKLLVRLSNSYLDSFQTRIGQLLFLISLIELF